jgi:hypothetical protein
MFGRYNLLCNSCNWEFVGLAIPGTVPEQHPRKRKKQAVNREQIQPQITAPEVNPFAEIRELSETVSLSNSNNQNIKEVADSSQTLPKDNLLGSESQSDINVKVSDVFSVIEATDETSPNINEILRISKSNDVLSDASDESKAVITVNDKDEPQHIKRKK